MRSSPKLQLIVISALVGCPALIHCSCSSPTPESYSEELAASVQSRLPMVDEVSELRAVRAEGNEVVHDYHFVTMQSTDPTLPALRENIVEITQRNVCSNTEATTGLDLGVTFRYIYRAADGPAVIDIRVDSATCAD